MKKAGCLLVVANMHFDAVMDLRSCHEAKTATVKGLVDGGLMVERKHDRQMLDSAGYNERLPDQSDGLLTPSR